jgi:pyruvate dehydrogenase complex dehydrogenase (E1) component
VQQEERERQRQEQLRIARDQYLQKMDQEAQRKKQAQDVMLKLENEERELINRLRKTQELQEKVGTCLADVAPALSCNSLIRTALFFCLNGQAYAALQKNIRA